MGHLHHLRVLVTRPDPAGTALCQLITAHQGEAMHCPTIAFAPPPDLAAFQRAITRLGEQQWVIFVSPQAVYASVSLLRQVWPCWPAAVRLAALGAGTARALQTMGLPMALYPEAEWNSEGLLSLPVFQQLAGQHIALVQGVGGRPLLAQTLIARGAAVLPVIAYKRVCPSIDVTPYLEALRAGKINRIVCSSWASVQHLVTLLGEQSEFMRIPLLVMSERVKKRARGLGFETVWAIAQADNTAILNTLMQKRPAYDG